MRVLFDTNIFISVEDDRIVPGELQQLVYVLHKIKAELLVHPLSLEEVGKDPDERRRNVMLSKIKAYPRLEMPPDPGGDVEYSEAMGIPANQHDVIDNHILYALYRNAVDFLVTEDRDIHKKAVKLGVDSRVLLIAEALPIFTGHLQKDSPVVPPALKETYVYNLDLRDPFFDSLKKEYPEFDGWFNKISREGRRCLVHYRGDGPIGALLIYKLEDEPIDSTPPLPKKRRVKISTLKVDQFGYKIGELFIKLSVDIAVMNDAPEIYLTHFVQLEDRLVELISEYGFFPVALNERRETVFIKKLFPAVGEAAGMLPFEVTRKYYPSLYDGTKVRKFIVPILPRYHARLFTSYKDRQMELAENLGYFIVEGNTIKKAYICNSRIGAIAQGDIILFYVSERKQLISIGVVESAHTGQQTSDDIIRLVGKRTVYSVSEIESMSRRPSVVILFWQYFHFSQPVPYAQLKSMGTLKGPPRSILQIPHSSYLKIKETAGIHERFTVH